MGTKKVAVKACKELELFCMREYCLGFSVKRYITLGDAWHHIFIVVGLRRSSQNPNGSLRITIDGIFLGIIGERKRIPHKPI